MLLFDPVGMRFSRGLSIDTIGLLKCFAKTPCPEFGAKQDRDATFAEYVPTLRVLIASENTEAPGERKNPAKSHHTPHTGRRQSNFRSVG